MNRSSALQATDKRLLARPGFWGGEHEERRLESERLPPTTVTFCSCIGLEHRRLVFGGPG